MTPEDCRNKMTEQVQAIWTKAQLEKAAQFRGEQQSAFYSPQRDMMHLLPKANHLSSLLCLSNMSEDDQTKLGVLPSLMQCLFHNEEGGYSCILPTIMKAMDEDSESTAQYLANFGLAVLLFVTHYPGFSIPDVGQLDQGHYLNIAVSSVLAMLPEEQRDAAKKAAIAESVSYLFSDEMKECVSQLYDLEEKWIETVNNKQEEQTEDTNGQMV